MAIGTIRMKADASEAPPDHILSSWKGWSRWVGPILGVAVMATAAYLASSHPIMGALAVLVFVGVSGWALSTLLGLSPMSITRVVLAVPLGLVAVMLVSIWLSTVGVAPSGRALTVTLSVVVTFATVPPTAARQQTGPQRIGAGDLAVFAGLVAIAMLLRSALEPHSGFLGYDPYNMASMASLILRQGLDPQSFIESPLNVAGQYASGAYYLLAGLVQISDLPVDTLVRWSPLPVFAVILILLYGLMRTAGLSPLAAAFAPLIVAGSPFALSRFSMLVRENLGIVSLLAAMTLLVGSARNTRSRWAMWLAGLLAGSAWQFQPTAGIIATSVFAVGMLQGATISPAVRIAGMIGLILGAAPSGFMLMFALLTITVPQIVQGLRGDLLADSNARFIWTRGTRLGDYHILALPFGVSGLLLESRRRTRAWWMSMPIIGFVSVVFVLGQLGASLPIVRTVVYLVIVLGIGSSLLADSLLRGTIRGRHRKTRGRMIRQGVSVALLAVVAGTSALTVSGYRKWSPYEQDQILSARRAVRIADALDAKLFSNYNEVGLLVYAGAENVEVRRDVVLDLLTASGPEELRVSLDEINADGEILFFGSKRFLGDGIAVHPDVLAGYPNKYTFFELLGTLAPERLTPGKLVEEGEPVAVREIGRCVSAANLGAGIIIRFAPIDSQDCQ